MNVPSCWLLNTLKTHLRLYDNILELINCLDSPNSTQLLVGTYALFFALCQSSAPLDEFLDRFVVAAKAVFLPENTKIAFLCTAVDATAASLLLWADASTPPPGFDSPTLSAHCQLQSGK
ncbi:hypothetical protein DSO57_1022043 [Entomophthora muscae]|uniref:Uncharacterized protein n=1 Tax=Entomophthora muscae TaxID=34485 RepID=A0ACC2RHU7_9FUNG|nr:hypothetical protein DSO57_1022043 [Entomophthora muscae]